MKKPNLSSMTSTQDDCPARWPAPNSPMVIAAILGLALLTAHAGDAGRRHPENELLARPGVRVTVALRNADIIGSDNRALQAAVDYVGNLGGGVVEIGPGEYLMRDALHLRSRVTVRGTGAKTVLKKDREHRSLLAADGDFGEAAITVENPEGFAIGRGVYVASKTMRNFLGVCATILNSRSNYFTLSRSLNADILMEDGGFAVTVYPVISGYNLEEARVENLTVDGNRAENPTKVDGCRTAGIFLYRGDHCVVSNCFVRDYNGDGISFQQSNDVQVEGCVVERCAGFGLHPGSGSQRPSVKNSRAIANGEDGFFFCWRVRGGVAEGNWLENNGGYGMSIGHKDSDNLVRKNTIIGNKLGGVYWREETEPMAAHRITFEDNVVRNNEGWGLFVNGATRNTIIRSNVIEDTGSGRQKTGIRIGKQAGEVTMEDNTIKAANQLQDERKKK
jgi:parallel beta-helix repeat protein